MKDVGVRLKVSGEGLENVSALTRELDKAGVSTAEFDAKAEALSAEFKRLAEQQALIDQFKRVKLAVDDADTAMKAAQNDAQSLAREIAATEAPTKAQATAFDKARAAVNAADQAYQAQVGQLQQLRTQLGTAGVSTDELAGAQVRVRSQLDATRKGVADLQGELKGLASQQTSLQGFEQLARGTEQARQALAAADTAVEAFKRGMIDAAAPTKVEAQELARLTEGARQVQIAFQQQSAQQALAATALRATGVSTDQLTAAQARGRAQAGATVAGIDSVSASTRGMTAAQLAAESEIRQITAALEKLASNSRVSGAEFDKAFTTGQQRIAKLRAEVATVPPALDATTKSSNLLGDGIRRAAAFFSVFTVGKQFVDANVQIESLRRTLTLITGSTDKASQQFAFLKKTADDTGVSVASLAGPFSRFVASAGAAGISLETVDRTFASVTKAAATLGLSSEDTAGALVALGQMASKGKVSMEELGQQLGDRLPAVLATTASGLGITTAEMTKLIEQGGLLADESFFKAFAKGVEDTFVKGAGKISSFQAELGRLKTNYNELLVSLGDSGLLSALSDTLKLLGPIVAFVGTTFVVLGKTIGTVAAATVDLAGKLLTLDFNGLVDGLRRGRDAARELADELAKKLPDAARYLDIFGVRSKAAGEEQKKLADGGAATAKAVTQTGDAAKAAAAAHNTLAAGTKAAGAEATTAVDRWVSLTVAYDKMIGKAVQAVDQASKLADAKKTEGDATVKLAEVAGNEVRVREAGVAAAEANAKALLAVAAAKQSEADLTQIKIAALRQEAIDTGTLTEARKKELVELELKLKGLQAEAAGANAAAEAANIEATARNVATKAVQDNSGALAELKRAYEDARNELALTTAAEKTGAASKDEVQAATRRLAEAEALYHDALDDTASALARKAERQKQAADITLATFNLQKAQLESQLELAKLDGNDALALDTRIKLKQLEVKIIEAKIAATKLEALATIAKAEADKAALEAEGKLTDAQRLAIDAAIAGAKVKLLEADAQQVGITLMLRQIENLKIYGDEAGKARDKSRSGIDKERRALEENTRAADKNRTTLVKLGGSLSDAAAGTDKLTSSSTSAAAAMSGLAGGFEEVRRGQVTNSQGYVDLVTKSERWAQTSVSGINTVDGLFENLASAMGQVDNVFSVLNTSSDKFGSSLETTMSGALTNVNALKAGFDDLSAAAETAARNARLAAESVAEAIKSAADLAALSDIATANANSVPTQLAEKKANGTLTSEDIGDAQRNFDAAKANLSQAQRNLGAVSGEGFASLLAEFNRARLILEKASSSGLNTAAPAPAPAVAGARTGGGSSATPSAASSTGSSQPMNLYFNSEPRGSITVSSTTDVKVIESLLLEIARSQGASSYP